MKHDVHGVFMTKFTFITLTFIFALCPVVHAEPPAGILLYFKAGPEVYLLLADHQGAKNRGWGGFGGGALKGEKPAETAVRETVEETRGYFLAADLLKQIEAQTPVIDADGFALFFAEVPFVPAQRVANHQPKDSDRAYFERGTFAWIPFSEVQKHLVKDLSGVQKYLMDKRFLPTGTNADWFWDVWISNMKMALDTQALPWVQVKYKPGN